MHTFLCYTAIQCPPGMVYQQCGPLCPQTCDNIGTSNCQGGCAEGCFCPDDQVWYNGSCIATALCPGKYKYWAFFEIGILFPSD